MTSRSEYLDDPCRTIGQFEQVRMHGHDGENERRRRSAGVLVSVERPVPELAPVDRRGHRLIESEDIYLCKQSAS